MQQVNSSGIIKHNFDLTTNGGIIISEESMGVDIFTQAKKHDIDSNGLLEQGEIRSFLESFKDVKSRAYLYDQDTDENGNITRRTFLNKYDSQMSFFYENGNTKPSKVILYLTEKDIQFFKHKYKEHHLNLKTMQAEAFDDNSSTDRVVYELNVQECRAFEDMATIRTPGFIESIIRRFFSED